MKIAKINSTRKFVGLQYAILRVSLLLTDLIFNCSYMSEATDVWERILINNPLDMLALKFCHDSYFYLGYLPQMRDSIARVFPSWNDSMPNYGYVLWTINLCIIIGFTSIWVDF